MPIKLAPQEEEEVVRMILRDAKKAIMREKANANFSNMRVKSQKIVFMVAEELDIPITRSWYLYGGYVHCGIMDIENTGDLDEVEPAASFDLFGKGIEAAISITPEQIGITPANYYRVVERVAVKVFRQKLEDFLREFYQAAPEPYRKPYLCNTRLNGIFKKLEANAPSSDFGLDGFLEDGRGPSLTVYNMVAPVFSEFLEEFARSGLDEVYEAFFRFAEIFERYAVKLGSERKGFNKLASIGKFYRENVWKTAALRFSIETVEGIRAEQVRRTQQAKLESLLDSLPGELDSLESGLESEGLMPSFSEMAKFFERRYGNGGGLARALIGAMRENG